MTEISCSLRNLLCVLSGIFGGWIVFLFGGWSEGMATLVALMVVDYITGVMVALVFRNSSKTDGGGLKSSVGFKGLCKKFTILLLVAVMYKIDCLLDINYLMDASIIGFALNEVLSITENAGLMGIPLPQIITKAIELLNEKAGVEIENEDK